MAQGTVRRRAVDAGIGRQGVRMLHGSDCPRPPVSAPLRRACRIALRGRVVRAGGAGGAWPAAPSSARWGSALATGLWWPLFFPGCLLIPRGKAEERVAHVRSAYEQLGGPLAVGAMCRAYGLIGRPDEAATHRPGMPDYRGIRGDPRFRALLAKTGLD